MINSHLPPELEELHEKTKSYVKEYGLDCFEVIFEMLDYDQINSVAAGGGFPKRYPHWRFGMSYDQLSKGYSFGVQKIYELVINTDPCYAYLMRSNSFLDQKLVMAHVYGHCDFFKNNIWFSKTNRKMLDQMANNAVRIRRYMDQYGEDIVENFIDCCISIEDLIDPYLPFVPKKEEQKDKEFSHEVPKLQSPRNYLDSYMNPPEFLEKQKEAKAKQKSQERRIPANPQRDILLFLLQYGQLENWQSDVLSIVRDESYYFAPQRMTKVMNEGWASYWHAKIMTERALDSSEIIDFANVHAGVMAVGGGQLNPYKLGIELFRHIEERWDKGRFGKEYEDCDDYNVKKAWDRKLNKGREKIFEVRKTHNDITFIDDFFTEEFCEEQRFYTYNLNPRTNKYEIKTRECREVKEEILDGLSNGGQPIIMVIDGNFRNRGELLLHHEHHNRDLDVRYAKETMRNISQIWGRPVHIETIHDGHKKLFSYQDGEFREEKISGPKKQAPVNGPHEKK